MPKRVPVFADLGHSDMRLIRPNALKSAGIPSATGFAAAWPRVSDAPVLLGSSIRCIIADRQIEPFFACHFLLFLPIPIFELLITATVLTDRRVAVNTKVHSGTRPLGSRLEGIS